jgi:hypothetical protein
MNTKPDEQSSEGGVIMNPNFDSTIADELRKHKEVLCKELQSSISEFTNKTGVFVSGIHFSVEKIRDENGKTIQVMYWKTCVDLEI